jgi:hypothetical protein
VVLPDAPFHAIAIERLRLSGDIIMFGLSGSVGCLSAIISRILKAVELPEAAICASPLVRVISGGVGISSRLSCFSHEDELSVKMQIIAVIW